ncbi:related to IMP1 - protease, mitochondrial [Ustilago trichophora]|uniref:Related to IMP1 - protease, mitochondrial n=1 Tax=Ustilago trichophora TaxID=86804 RepID=A0A5C3DYH9_9BASI|nr:related to IMP1 - protease, mitochondrial [Ustilago trichophora]
MSQLLLRRPWIRKTAYTTAITLQIACAVHLVNEHVFEVRNSTGASMLPTLAPEGDFLLQLRLPFARFLSSLGDTFSPSEGEAAEGESHPYYHKGKRSNDIGGSRFSKTDQAQGTGLKVGDLVVALSPFDASRSVCKRVIGLPGDTVALDPRMRPIPESAWRGRTAVQSRVKDAKKSDVDGLESKMVSYEDLLASVGAPSSISTASSPSSQQSNTRTPTNTAVKGEVDLLSSMDTDSPSPSSSSTPQTDTAAHNAAAITDLTTQTYVRSKGDVQYITVPLGHVWLAGENMANSTDSRHYGPVPLGMVRGKVLARVWPNPRWLSNNLSFVD